MSTDTIAAIATGLSAGGISIIRISGPEASSIASGIFRVGNKENLSMPSFEQWESHTVHYGFVVEDDRIVDEVMLLYLKAPKTYTREDTIEIDCHGGIVVTKRILSLVLSHGARLAEPGEFTKRAFLNGRIDLSQAEAVMGIISAKNDLALRNSVKQLRGKLRTRILSVREEILNAVAEIEAALDQPEYYTLDGFRERLFESLERQSAEIRRLIRSADDGRMMSEGIRTVILGKPNVGKSSLLNALLEEDRAIVTDIAGTTRDTLTEEIRVNGISLVLVDTAGIRNTLDPVEEIGVRKAREQAQEADLILFVADASVPLDENDKEILRGHTNARVLALLNKSDLSPVTTEEDLKNLLSACGCDAEILSISAKDGAGLNELRDKISGMFFSGDILTDDEVAITAERQKECLYEAEASLSHVLEALSADMPEDFLSIDLMGAYGALSRILGEEVDEDLIDRIFETFCLGK
ncbi:MAG: tRNA uridine-5-carboxymethylaminomethyl(34) synthesis GTPase MnmE [Lachnospiraceae bacterium]|nr:tRNA uridine-5-carboxymethylaminomethyl(34) synthesis GTPase MnmE [Lachnospiraceae bacterium]